MNFLEPLILSRRSFQVSVGSRVRGNNRLEAIRGKL
jgi:hypothetical protein